MRFLRGFGSIRTDLRYALRQLRLNPGFTAIAVLSLALGIGANSAIFQLINAIGLRGLPVKEPRELAAIDTAPDFFVGGWSVGRNRIFTYAQYQELRTHQEAFTDILAFGTNRFNLSRGGEARYVEGLYVTTNFLDVLGVAPVVGRGFAPQRDDRDCSGAGALLNYAFWQSEYGGDPAAVGRTISFDGQTLPIIGVTPKNFFGIEPARRFDVAIPLCADTVVLDPEKSRMDNRSAWWLTLVGRMKPGWNVDMVSTHVRDLSPRIFEATVPPEFPQDAVKRYLKNRMRAVPGYNGVSSLRQDYEDPLFLLMALTGLVLLIACANLANLLLARATAREREMAVRQAIGASRGRLINQLLIESLLLAGLGAAFGAAVAQTLSEAMVVFLSSGNQRLVVMSSFDWRVFAFISALALTTCLLFGLAPALRATHTAPANAMRGGRTSTATAEKHGLRRALVVSQIALSMILLVGAILFGRTLKNLLTVETGIDSESVLVANVDARLPKLDPERRRSAFQLLLERIRSQPGAEAAATVRFSPFSNFGWNQNVYADTKTGERMLKLAWFNRTGPGYFQTLKTPLLAGRDFTAHDRTGSPKVAIVNEQFAKTVFGGTNPIGRTFRTEGDAGEPDVPYEVVGLVRNTKYSSLREEFRPIAFLAVDQAEDVEQSMTFIVRTRGPIDTVVASVRQELAELHPELLVEFRTLELQQQQSILRERLMANLSGGFGLVATLLSMLGLYGVMSYMVVRRRNEIGIRMAIGAEWGDVVGLIMRETGKLVAIGLAVGSIAALALARYTESMLFGLQPHDPLTVAAGCGLLALTAVLASWLPARGAARLDPASVLRDE